LTLKWFCVQKLDAVALQSEGEFMPKDMNAFIQYEWAGLNRTGQKTRGVIEARSLAIAKAELRQQGILTKNIHKKRKKWLDRANRKIKPQDITFFSRQMATMIQAGIPLIQSFDIVSKGLSNQNVKNLVEKIKKEVETGTVLAHALRKYPQYFNTLFCSLIDAGEKSGSLDIMLDKVATYKEKIEAIKKKIKKALIYPTAVLVVALLVTIGLLMFVVPQFESLFSSFGANLPALTQMVIYLSNYLKSYWYIIFGTLGVAVYLFRHFLKHSPTFAQTIDRYLLKMPVIGSIMINAAIARFSRTLAITFAAGLPLVEALTSVAGATGNILYIKATDKIREDISSGQTLQLSIEKTNLFPSMVVQMIAIGEESGTLEKMLGKIADFYEEAVDYDVDALSSLLEPIIMSILGILVGGLVVAMYLPIFKLGSVV
jgi:type IV pilus assembly protein PilC